MYGSATRLMTEYRQYLSHLKCRGHACWDQTMSLISLSLMITLALIPLHTIPAKMHISLSLFVGKRDKLHDLLELKHSS